MNQKLLSVYQGDTTDVIIARPMVLDTGELIDASFICKISAKDSTGAVVVPVRTVTEKAIKQTENSDGSMSDEDNFLCYLLPSETESLTTDDNTLHELIIEVKNISISPVFSIEEHYSLQVKEQGIP